MAYFLQTKSLFFSFFLLLVVPLSISSSPNSGKVSLGLYYESLCPYCSNFIVNYLAKLYQDDDLFSIVDLHLSPWGNTRLKINGSIVCQHGPSECLLDTVEACAIHVWPKLEEHFPFINCVETLVHERQYAQWETCFEKLGLDPNPIEDCYSSGLGNELELKYAAETNDLQPPHQYVPWVVVNGEPLYEDYENFVSYICKAYKGTLKTAPKACRETYNHNIRMGKSSPVTHKEKKISALSERIISGISSWMHRVDEVAST
ncbi:gamma interferon responsive lysosomal thiol (GILT) reductase family protein [Euphorbia peplus]|nr:gamma interferon responsive lysosomal thiol (GILT) reductase family protein [Euphorbia peplus]